MSKQMTPKETLTVEWLPAYNKYRVWNTWAEIWFNTWEEFSKYVRENKLLEQYNFVSYNTDLDLLLEEMK